MAFGEAMQRRALMTWIGDLITLKWFTGHRTTLIGGGMILTGLGAILAHLAAVIGGETSLDWETLKAAGATIATGAGLLAASVHKA